MRRRRRPLRLAVPVLALCLCWAAGFVWFAAALPTAVEDAARRTDAIVVLTGGSERLPEGMRLLQAGLAQRLFVSGVYSGVDVETILALDAQAPATLSCCIELGHDARHTVGNARETAAWMARMGFSSLRLVTANYHMPRSLALFRRAMPGIAIVPHPVFPQAVWMEAWWRRPATLALLAGEYTKYLVSLAWPPA